jgi:hypothetical protein
VLRGVIPILADEGVWTLGSNTSGTKQPVRGPMLWGVWAVEAATIVGFATILPWRRVRKAIYCEACERWATKVETVQPFVPVGDPKGLRGRLESGDLAALAQLDPIGDDALDYSRFILKWCDTCDGLDLLSVKSISLVKNSKGELQEKETVVVENLHIDREARDLIAALRPAPPAEPAAASPEPAAPPQDPENPA